MPAFNLSKTPIHISTQVDRQFEVLENFSFDETSFGQYIADHCTETDPGCMVMFETSPQDWTSWERHPKGDELVIVFSGQGTFYQQSADGVVEIPFAPGDTMLNRKGVWHTADIEIPLIALYITTCPETDHKARE